jgi:NAD(P)-dependent dehydrogenase (short-subunit alcohol dehydrogenase family)
MKSALITGANRGIGLEFVRQYLADGWQVYAACRDPERAEQLQALAKEFGDRLQLLRIDVTNAHEVKAAAERLKGKPLDVLINNAGVVEKVFYGSGAYEGHDDPDLRNYDFEGWLDVLKTNLLGPARICGAFVDNLAAGQRPVAVNMVSTLASVSGTWQAGRYAYRTSKAALNMLTRSVGEWYQSRSIILVSISPGWTQTAMGGTKATNTAEQSAGGVRRVIANLTPDDTGKFLDFKGETMPW